MAAQPKVLARLATQDQQHLWTPNRRLTCLPCSFQFARGLLNSRPRRISTDTPTYQPAVSAKNPTRSGKSRSRREIASATARPSAQRSSVAQPERPCPPHSLCSEAVRASGLAGWMAVAPSAAAKQTCELGSSASKRKTFPKTSSHREGWSPS